MKKKTYRKPEALVYELGPEQAQICTQSETGEASPTNEFSFGDELGDEEQY